MFTRTMLAHQLISIVQKRFPASHKRLPTQSTKMIHPSGGKLFSSPEFGFWQHQPASVTSSNKSQNNIQNSETRLRASSRGATLHKILHIFSVIVTAPRTLNGIGTEGNVVGEISCDTLWFNRFIFYSAIKFHNATSTKYIFIQIRTHTQSPTSSVRN